MRSFPRLSGMLLAVPLDAAAADIARPAYTPPPAAVSSGSIVQIIFSLLLVLAAIALVAWLLKRINTTRQGSGNFLRVVGGVAIGQRERVVLVEINDTWLVVGVGPGQIRTLHTLPKPEEGFAQPTASETGSTQPKNFAAELASRLSTLTQGKQRAP